MVRRRFTSATTKRIKKKGEKKREKKGKRKEKGKGKGGKGEGRLGKSSQEVALVGSGRVHPGARDIFRDFDARLDEERRTSTGAPHNDPRNER